MAAKADMTRFLLVGVLPPDRYIYSVSYLCHCYTTSFTLHRYNMPELDTTITSLLGKAASNLTKTAILTHAFVKENQLRLLFGFEDTSAVSGV
jgi:hypothetical protein